MRPKAEPAPTAARFGDQLKVWRRINGIKQAALAETLGVSQPAVARWEAGLDVPAASRLRKLRQMMADAVRDEFAIESLFVQRQSAIRALIDLDGVRIVAASDGLRRVWPAFSAIGDAPMADYLINEASLLFHSAEVGEGIRDGSLCIASGVSDRHVSLNLDQAVHHAWHIHFRRIGHRRLADVVYESCPGDVPSGIVDLVHIDALGKTDHF